jgi:hypothetical protein
MRVRWMEVSMAKLLFREMGCCKAGALDSTSLEGGEARGVEVEEEAIGAC